MRILSTIMELNPPHNGHKYFLNEINKKKKKDDILIVVLSSCIVQRGEFSVINPIAKTKFLLNNNVDLIIELPAVFANQGGFYFAKSAIEILHLLNVDEIFFGSETNNLEELKNYSFNFQNNKFNQGIYNNLNLKSNDILGISYLAHLKTIKPNLIKRINNNYNDNFQNTSNIQSATYIRNNLNDPKINNFLDEYLINSIQMIEYNLLFPTFLINLNYILNNDIKIFLSENNEILYKFKKIINKYKVNNFDDLILYAKDKNNSQYKIKRIILNTIFIIEEKKIINYKINQIRILGFNDKGKLYIKNNKEKINFITSLKNNNDYIYEKEIIIKNIYNLLSKNEIDYNFGKPIILGENYEQI